MTKHDREQHGQHGTPTYVCWVHMWQRCTNPKVRSYKSHGARGIKVCERWRSFSAFFADMGEKPQGLTLEREDNDGDYTPENCVWAPHIENVQNSRKAKLTAADVKLIRRLREIGADLDMLAVQFDVSRPTISQITTFHTWRNVS